MKIVGRAGDFLAALTPSVRIAPAKSPIEILTHLLVRASEDGVYVIANDLDKESRIRAPVTVTRSGSAVIPREAEAFLKRLKSDAAFEMSVEGDVAKLTSGRARMSLPALSADDFPSIGDGNFTSTFTMPAADLARALAQVDFAMSNEETRYYLCGVNVLVEGDKLSFAATDGHRLGVCDIARPAGMDGRALIPDRTVKELRSWGTDGELRLSFSDTLMKAESDGRVLVSKLIDGTFPDYRRIIPRDFKAEASADREELLSAFNLVSVSLASHSGVRVELTGEGMTLTGHNGAGKQSATTLDNMQYDGAPLTTGINAKYAVAALSAMACETVRLRLTDSHLVFDDPLNAGQLIVVMSMRA
jgi:DNA polymerase-3 subunit beta